MIICKYAIDGKCIVASEIAGIPCGINQQSCDACQKQSNPMQSNPVTLGLARTRLRAEGLPFEHLYPDEVKKVIDANREKQSVRIKVTGKPGSSLKLILHKAGVFGEEGCGCDDYAKLMDLWGVNTCEQKIEEIIAHLNSQNVSWFDMLRVAKAGYLTTRSLVQAAIDKARG